MVGVEEREEMAGSGKDGMFGKRRKREKGERTIIVFSLEEDPGVLFKAIAVFALWRINLTMDTSTFVAPRLETSS
ncbi:hypothetical protein FNV43_RR24378 [Rhamnella rubrinervis]|uniref:Uncharacterized protein n=1 Tax=Rhamnella rubrinervis TaxID=2594499 RepID=A0A8K0DR23_9ROSA|nr:hypothetical protein FNV43_RR24378 [Rhamnella rubrinervis]